MSGAAARAGERVTAIRPAREGDAPRIAEIYNAGIEGREATFETGLRDAGDVSVWVGRDDEPLLVAERDESVVGWARAVRSSDRCAYQGVGEYTIYIDPPARGQGVGLVLLDALSEAAEHAGFWKLIGRIFTTNVASGALARRCGFDDVGVHRRQGRLDGEWKDVLVVERLLGEARDG